MKRVLFISASMALGLAVCAQQEVIVKEERVISDTVINPQHGKEQKVITLKLKGDKADEKKYVIEVDGDKIKVNGKDIADIKDIDVTIGKNRVFMRSAGAPGQFRVFTNPEIMEERRQDMRSRFPAFGETKGEPRALLGVGMEKTDKGVKVISVTENSAAEKAGLQKGDIISQIDGKKITTEMELTSTISSHKPGDQVEVTYNRDGKDKKVKTTLGKREDDMAFWFNEVDGRNLFVPGQPIDLGHKFNEYFENHPNLQKHFEYKIDQNGNAPFIWNEGDGPGAVTIFGQRPKLGVNIKETESGKGLEVIEVEESSAADKAGLKKGDIITDVAGKPVSTVEDIRKAVNEAKEKPFNLQYQRNGKSSSVEIKFPKKLREASL